MPCVVVYYYLRVFQYFLYLFVIYFFVFAPQFSLFNNFYNVNAFYAGIHIPLHTTRRSAVFTAFPSHDCRCINFVVIILFLSLSLSQMPTQHLIHLKLLHSNACHFNFYVMPANLLSRPLPLLCLSVSICLQRHNFPAYA